MEDGRFQLQKMDDAVDCYQQIMGILVDKPGSSAAAASMGQQLMVEMLEQYQCSCGTTSEPTPSVQSVLYFPATALANAKGAFPRHSFGKLLREAFITESTRSCQREACKTKVSPSMNLLNAPAVLTFGMSWTSDNPSTDTIKSVLRGLQPVLKVDEAFGSAGGAPYKLLSLVCYYGKHYACFVHDDATSMWTYFDDSIVRNVGKSWDDVLTKCEGGRWQPQLLVYHRPGQYLAATPAPPAATAAPVAAASPRSPAVAVPTTHNLPAATYASAPVTTGSGQHAPYSLSSQMPAGANGVYAV